MFDRRSRRERSRVPGRRARARRGSARAHYTVGAPRRWSFRADAAPWALLPETVPEPLWHARRVEGVTPWVIAPEYGLSGGRKLSRSARMAAPGRASYPAA